MDRILKNTQNNTYMTQLDIAGRKFLSPLQNCMVGSHCLSVITVQNEITVQNKITKTKTSNESQSS